MCPLPISRPGSGFAQGWVLHASAAGGSGVGVFGVVLTGDTVEDRGRWKELSDSVRRPRRSIPWSASTTHEPALGFAAMEPTTDTLEVPTDPKVETTEPLVEEELLVEEISIDGMCGVY